MNQFKSHLTIYNDLMDEGTQFDDFEVHPLCNASTDPEQTMFVICEPDEAEMYGVYIHIPEMGIECIADCDTEETANNLVDILIKTGKLFLK